MTAPTLTALAAGRRFAPSTSLREVSLAATACSAVVAAPAGAQSAWERPGAD